MKHSLTFLAAAVAATFVSAAGAATVTSPDGRIALRIEDDDSRFTVTRGGKELIASSPLGLELEGAAELGALALQSRKDVKVDRRIPLVATKASVARDHYRGATLVFRERAGASRQQLRPIRACRPSICSGTARAARRPPRPGRPALLLPWALRLL